MKRPRRNGLPGTLGVALLGAALGLLAVSVFTAQAGHALDEATLERFDPDVYPAIDVSHRFPAVLVVDESADLEFTFACGYMMPGEVCDPEAVLYVGYGAGFTAVPLAEEDRDSLRMLVAHVGTTDAKGGTLQYFLEVRDSRHGVSLRYPTAGVFAPFVTTSPIDITLDSGSPGIGLSVATLDWGRGSDQVGLQWGPQQPANGPEAIAVASSGRLLAILDSINGRAIIRDTLTGASRYVEVTARLGDIAIKDDGDVTILDGIGVEDSRGGPPLPQLSVFGADGALQRQATVYMNAPYHLNADATVTGVAGRAVLPFMSSGSPAERAVQRAVSGPTVLDVYFRHDGQVLLADRSRNQAFRVTAAGGVGPIAAFERYVAGYVLVMDCDAGLDLVWFDTTGNVTSHQTVARQVWADSSPRGRIAVDEVGRVYVMNSTLQGVGIVMFEEGRS